MAPDTETLITEAGRGDTAAIDQLLGRHLPGLRAYIRLRMGPRVRRWDSESDVAQSVCLEILKNLDGFSYRGEAAFRQWLFTMARRKLVERDRRLTADKRDVDRLVTNAAAPDTSADAIAGAIQRAFGTPSELAIREETLRRIEKALDGMSEEAREVILMSRLAGISNAEIARRLGKERSSVRSMLSRALADLAHALT